MPALVPLTWNENAPVQDKSSPTPHKSRLLEGRVQLRDVALGESRSLRMSGAMDIRVGSPSGDGSFQADLDLSDLQMHGHRISHMRGRVFKAADESIIRLQDLHGQFCGGRVAGSGDLELGDTPAYRLAVNVEDIDLSQILALSEEPGDEASPMTGRLAGILQLRGVMGTSQREASGRLVISHGKLVRVPIILGLVNTIFLQLPTSDSLSDGRVEYLLRGDNLRLGNIHLWGGNVSILGSGKVDLSTEQVNLLFVSGAPKLVPTVVAELWQLTAEGVAPVVVTGSWKHPKTRTVPLSELRILLQQLGTGK